jgi:hypothetical protein
MTPPKAAPQSLTGHQLSRRDYFMVAIGFFVGSAVTLIILGLIYLIARH